MPTPSEKSRCHQRKLDAISGSSHGLKVWTAGGRWKDQGNSVYDVAEVGCAKVKGEIRIILSNGSAQGALHRTTTQRIPTAGISTGESDSSALIQTM